ncbi:MAG: YihY/virulence factor BrkB family protein [Bacteroidota bacterium]
MNIVQSLIQFFQYDLWKLNLKKLPVFKKYIYQQLRVIVLVIKGFDKDQGALHASALTFFSVLAIVPFLAVIFGIAQVFGFQSVLEEELSRNLAAQKDVLDYLLKFTESLLVNTKGGTVAIVGFVIVLFTILRLLSNIEASFNVIWGIKKQRPLIRKLTDYISILLIAPIIVAVSSSATFIIRSQVTQIVESIAFLEFFSSAIVTLLKLSPFVLIIILLTLIYMVMPNTKVKFKSALIAGIIAGTAYELIQVLYVTFQFGVSRYNAIYGAFSLLPLFIIWMQLSWIVILMGAELSFAIQNVEKYDFLNESTSLSYTTKKKLYIYIIFSIVKDFKEDTPPIDSSRISNQLRLPGNLIAKLLVDLEEAGLIKHVEVNEDGDLGYVPAVDTDLLDIKFIIDKLENYGLNHEEMMTGREQEDLEKAISKLEEERMKSKYNIKLKEIKYETEV